MAKRHYIPVTADVPGVSDGQRAFLRRAIRTQVEDPAAEALLNGALTPGDTAVFTLREGALSLLPAPAALPPGTT